MPQKSKFYLSYTQVMNTRVFAFLAIILLAGCATQEPKPVATTAPQPTEITAEKEVTATGPGGGTLTAKKSVTVTPQAPPKMKGFAWDPNPADQLITAYNIYQVKGTDFRKVATITTTDYHPAKKGTYYVTAVSVQGESPPSQQITL